MKALASTSLYDFFYQDHLLYITSSDSVGGRSIWLEVVGVGVVLTHPPSSSRRRSRSSQLRPPAILAPWWFTAPLRNPKTLYEKRRQQASEKKTKLGIIWPPQWVGERGTEGGVQQKEGHPLYVRGIKDEGCSKHHNLSLYGFACVSWWTGGIGWGGSVTDVCETSVRWIVSVHKT
jgi:hypothetical protein